MGEEARGGVEICGCQFECVWDWGGVCGGVSEGDDDDFSDCESILVSRPEVVGKVTGGFANETCGQPIPMYNWVAFVGFAAYSIYAQTNGMQGNVGELCLGFATGGTMLMMGIQDIWDIWEAWLSARYTGLYEYDGRFE